METDSLYKICLHYLLYLNLPARGEETNAGKNPWQLKGKQGTFVRIKSIISRNYNSLEFHATTSLQNIF